MVERKRGRAGMEQRARRLKLFPYCAECFKRGEIRATRIIDHVVPLALGGSDEDENCQGLCLLCNAIKTAAEDASSSGAANHPDWLQPSAVPLVIVAGPPLAGKARYVEERASADDLVISFDVIARRIDPSYDRWSGISPDLFNATIRARNALLGSLARASGCSAWFILGAAQPAERAWWVSKLGGSMVLVDPGHAECQARARSLGKARALAAVDRWRAASRLSWAPPKPRLARVGIGADGYPLEG